MQVDISSLRFLVADDSRQMRRMIGSTLEEFGIRCVYEAHNGAEALEFYQRLSPDILIVDWRMPWLDGIELTRRIRVPGSSPNPFIPIIMLTAFPKKELVEARDAGVTEFLCRPVSAKCLYGRILNIVLNPRPFVQTATYFGPDRRRHDDGSFPGLGRRKGEPGCMGMEMCAPNSSIWMNFKALPSPESGFDFLGINRAGAVSAGRPLRLLSGFSENAADRAGMDLEQAGRLRTRSLTLVTLRHLSSYCAQLSSWASPMRSPSGPRM